VPTATNANRTVVNHSQTLRNRMAACRKGTNVNRPAVNTGTARYHRLPILTALPGCCPDVSIPPPFRNGYKSGIGGEHLPLPAGGPHRIRDRC
jgi:hypothetical protein